ncbi:MAG: hypothetical protein WCK67_04170 [bacterium]
MLNSRLNAMSINSQSNLKINQKRDNKIALSSNLTNKGDEVSFSGINKKAAKSFTQKLGELINDKLAALAESLSLISKTTGKKLSIKNTGIEEIKRTIHGGYVLDNTPKVILYKDKDATNLLKKLTHFKKDTQILNYEGGEIRVTIGKESMLLSKKGAIQIGAGTKDVKIEVLKGNPVVVTTGDKLPAWYSPYKSCERHVAKFDEQIVANRYHYTGYISKGHFSAEDLEKMLQNGIAEATDNPKFVKFKEFETPEKIELALKNAEVKDSNISGIITQWSNSKQRMLSGLNLGTFSIKNDLAGLSENSLQALKENGIFVQNLPEINTDTLTWAKFHTKDELTQLMNKSGIVDKDQKIILNTYDKTYKAGYDFSGLAFEPQNGKPVTVYEDEFRIIVPNQKKTEWILNSTVWPGKERTGFVTGESWVNYSRPDGKTGLFPRGAEQLHIHPDDEFGSQSEIYLVQGKAPASLSVFPNGEMQHVVMENGDMVKVNPMLAHQVSAEAGDGEYRHSLFQTRCAFHQTYDGLGEPLPTFKVNKNAEDYGTTAEAIIQGGIDAINNLKNKSE